MNRFPLRVTPDQWNDIREHYEETIDPADYDELPQYCMECGCELTEDERLLCGECIAEVQRPPDPAPDDHDRRFMDFYDTREGDIGDDGPPY